MERRTFLPGDAAKLSRSWLRRHSGERSGRARSCYPHILSEGPAVPVVAAAPSRRESTSNSGAFTMSSTRSIQPHDSRSLSKLFRHRGSGAACSAPFLQSSVGLEPSAFSRRAVMSAEPSAQSYFSSLACWFSERPTACIENCMKARRDFEEIVPGSARSSLLTLRRTSPHRGRQVASSSEDVVLSNHCALLARAARTRTP
jgi:hypothetical protein